MRLKEIQPAQAGIHPKHILNFLNKIEENNLHVHSFALMRHDGVAVKGAFAPYRRDKNHMLQSCTKTFASIAIGFAVQEGLLSIEDYAIQFFPHIQPKDEKMKKIRIKDLLTMQTGHKEDTSELFADTEHDWVELFFQTEITFEPGTYWVYNTPATYLLTAILKEVAGENAFDFMKKRLFDPLEFSDGIYWEESPTGVTNGGFGLNITNEDLLKFGSFLLHKGSYNGKQLLDPAWIEATAQPWADCSEFSGGRADWAQGYGYQCWCCIHPHVFRGDGAFGQLCVVMPDQDAVFVCNNGLDDKGIVCFLDLFWDEIFHNFTAPIPADEEVAQYQKRLEEKLVGLTLQPYYRQEGMDSKKLEFSEAVIGKEFCFEENLFRISSLQVSESEAGYSLSVCSDGSRSTIPLAADTWRTFKFSLREKIYNPTWALSFIPGAIFEEAAVIGCTNHDKLLINLAFLNGALQDTWELTFRANELTLHIRRVVGMPPVEMTAIGKLQL